MLFGWLLILFAIRTIKATRRHVIVIRALRMMNVEREETINVVRMHFLAALRTRNGHSRLGYLILEIQAETVDAK